MVRPHPTIAVLGTLSRDTTVYADGTRTENLGGLLYTLSTLAHLCAGRARILPVANVGFDLFEVVRHALDLPGLDATLLRCVPVPNNHVHLTYRDAEARDEVLEGLVPPIGLPHCLQAAAADWLLVNLTSGRDIECDTLRELRARFAGVLQLDVHSLTLDIAPGGRRVLRQPERWREWVACADWLQVNATEARLLGGGTSPEEFAELALELGPRGVLVTLGRDGCLARWREGAEVRALRLPAARHPQPAFPTGCGDVFGAAFAHALLLGAQIESAVTLANAVASTKACYEPQGEIRRIREHASEALRRCFPADDSNPRS